MERLVALSAVLAFVSLCHTQKSVTVVVDDGRVGVGLITGGTFGPGSFSVGGSGGGRPSQTHVYVHENLSDGEHIIIKNSPHQSGQQDNRPPKRDSAESNNSGGVNAQLYPVKPPTTHAISIQGGMASEGGNIYIDTVILHNNENNKGNKIKNGNKQPVVTDASAKEAIFGSSGGSSGFPSADNGFSSTIGQTSILIGSITGGNFAKGTGSPDNNNRPNVLQKVNAVNNGNTGYPNAGNEAVYSIGHGANNGASNAGGGFNNGQINLGHNSEINEEPWIWSR